MGKRMWKDYSVSYIRKNRASSASVMAAALLAALLLSLLLSLLYSMWDYERERILREEGNFHARLTGRIDEEELTILRGYGNVESAEINAEESEGENLAVDVRLKRTADIYTEIPKLAELIGLHADQAVYNDALLSLYLVRNPRNPDGAVILAAFCAVTVFSCISLILVIHNAFTVFMNDRVHQFGILSSIGATPGQIRACLLQEAGALCTVPVLLGNLLGMAAAAAVLEGINLYLNEIVPDRAASHFSFHPLVPAASILCAAATVWISALIPARRMSRLTPLEAIRGKRGAEKKKEFSPSFFSVRGGGSSCGKRAEGAEKSASRGGTFPDPFLSRLYPDGMPAFPFTGKHPRYLLGQIPERMGYHDHREGYGYRFLSGVPFLSAR